MPNRQHTLMLGSTSPGVTVTTIRGQCVGVLLIGVLRQEPNNSVYLASSLAKSVITLNTTTYILPCQSNHYIIKVQSCKSFPTLSCGYLFYISQDLHSVARALRDKNQDPSNKGWESRFRSLELTIHNTQQEINDDSSCSQLNWQQER